MDVLLSIKPKYVDAILKGEKKYEFRKIIFKNKNIKKYCVVLFLMNILFDTKKKY